MGKVVIIGAGLAGLSAGYHAERDGIDYEIFERTGQAGGLSTTVERDGFLFDCSGHLLHLKDPYFKTLVKDLLAGNMNVIERKAFIYSHGVFTRYPFQANLYGLPPEVAKECLIEFVRASYGYEDLPTSAYASFGDWIQAKLGAGIGKHFMMPYNEKVWTVPTEELTCSWLSDYVPRPSLEDVFDGTFHDQRKGFGYNATFWYPKKGGIQALSVALAERVKNVRFHEDVQRIVPARKEIRLASGRCIPYDRLISTMPLKELVRRLDGEIPDDVKEAGRMLAHNSLLIVNLGVRGDGLCGKHWIYLPEKRYAPYRVGVYSNFSDSMAPPGTTSYYVEIAYRAGWNVDKDALVRKATADLLEIGLVRREEDILVRHVVDIPFAYVIYDRDHERCRSAVLDYLRESGIHSIGRYGAWEYSGMEEAMEQGRVAARAN